MECLIVSKDRPCQLDCLIRSVETNAPNLSSRINILFKTLHKKFQEGYTRLDRLFDNNLDIRRKIKSLVCEINFHNDLLSILENVESEYVLLLTDDTIFYRQFIYTGEELTRLFDKDTLCLSLRLGLNTVVQDIDRGTKMFPQPMFGYPMIGPDFKCCAEDFLVWDYKRGDINLNWNYPISMDGVVYKTSDILELSKSIDFQNLREWEGNLAYKVKDSFPKPLMVCPDQSVCVNVPLNFTQPPYSHHNQVSPYGMSLEELNQLFLDGYIMDYEAMFKNLAVVGSHQHVKPQFKVVTS